MGKDNKSEINDCDVFERRALVIEDFDEGIEAIRALNLVDKTRARITAVTILNEGIGDIFYQVAAFRELYEISVTDAVNYIEEKAREVNSYILGAMLTCITIDAGCSKNQDNVKRGVIALQYALDARPEEDLELIHDEKEFFEKTFQC